MSLLLTISILHFVAQLSPGPDVLLIAKSAASNTRANTLKIISGISVGIVVWVVLTLLGFTVLIEQWPWIQQLLMLFGGFFLAKMGWGMWQAGRAALQHNTVWQEGKVQAAQNYFVLGLLTNLSNPKTLIYFSSVFSLALSSSASESIKQQLAVLIPLQTFLTFALFMWIMSLPRIKTLYQRSGGYIDLISGALFMMFALWLWLDVLKALF